MTLLRFTVLFSEEYQQMYIIAGEAHNLVHRTKEEIKRFGEANPIISVSEYFHTLAATFPFIHMDCMVEMNPTLTRQQMTSHETILDETGSNNINDFMTRFHLYNAHRFFPEEAIPLPLPIRVSMVDARVSEGLPKSVLLLSSNATLFSRMNQGKYPSTKDLETFPELEELFRETIKEVGTVKGLQDDFGYTDTKDTMEDLKIQMERMHPKFKADIWGYLIHLRRRLEQDFKLTAALLTKLHGEFELYVESLSSSEPLPGSVSPNALLIKLTSLLADSMDIYAYTRFFHQFNKSFPPVAQNIMYLGGQIHTDNAIDMLVTKMKFKTIYDVRADQHGLIPLPSIDLIRAHLITGGVQEKTKK